MSTVRRTIYLNPIEPALLSFRAGTKVDTKLDVTYYGQNGLPLGSDVDGQLQLTSRTMAITKSYSMPATDIANGQARAVIPAGDVTDLNGYQAVLYGTVGSEAAILARGLVWPDAVEQPLAEPVDVIDEVPVTLERSQTTDTVLTVKLWDDTSKKDPYDLAAATVAAAIYTAIDGPKLVDFVTTVIDANTVQLTLTTDQIAGLPDNCWWSLRVGDVNGVTTLCRGPVTVSGIAVPPLVGATLQYSYKKPDQGDPAAGEIVHANWIRSELRISTTTNDLADATSTLSALRAGDTITDGVVLWTLQGPPSMATGFVIVPILPLDQLAAEAVAAFTFARP